VLFRVVVCAVVLVVCVCVCDLSKETDSRGRTVAEG